MIFLYANRIVPDGTPRSAASHLGLFCLPMFKGTPGLNELTAKPPRGRLPVEVVFTIYITKIKALISLF